MIKLSGSGLEVCTDILAIEGVLTPMVTAQSYCCRPPEMVHGPWIADIEIGCEEIVFIRHTKPANQTLTP